MTAVAVIYSVFNGAPWALLRQAHHPEQRPRRMARIVKSGQNHREDE